MRLSGVSTEAPLDLARGKLRAERRDLPSTISSLLLRERLSAPHGVYPERSRGALRSSIPALVREAFRLAQQERPGPVHLELPEDIAHEEWADVPLIPPHPIDYPAAPPAALDRAAELIRKAERPLVMLGAAASRPRLSEALRWGLPRKQGYRIWRRLVVSTKVRRAAWRDLLSTKSRLSLREGLSAPRFLLRSRRRKLPYAIVQARPRCMLVAF